MDVPQVPPKFADARDGEKGTSLIQEAQRKEMKPNGASGWIVLGACMSGQNLSCASNTSE